jgi:hypothetical protein
MNQRIYLSILIQLLSFPPVLTVIGSGHLPVVRIRLGTEDDNEKDEDREDESDR